MVPKKARDRWKFNTHINILIKFKKKHPEPVFINESEKIGKTDENNINCNFQF